MKITLRYARHAGIAALFVAAALLGTLSGVLFAYSDDLPAVSALDNYSPNTITRILGRDDQLVGEFAVERRVVLHYDEIPEQLRQAILSAEDANFFSHFGLSPSGIMRSVIKNVLAGRKVGGASTLTQQLARKLFLTDEKTWERKVKEQLLAVQIEKRYTKQEIFTFYANQMYFGHGAYGVESAAQLYFGKHVQELGLPEAAMIAGILQGNARQSPYNNPEAAMRRRNYALGRMAEEGYITGAEAEAAAAIPIVTRGDAGQNPTIAPYFIEEVRKYLEANYGAKVLYESGLTVRTALDPRLQAAANNAVDRGLRRVDKRRGFRRSLRNVVSEGEALDSFNHDRWARMSTGDFVPALVTRATSTAVDLRIGTITAELTRAGLERWPRNPALDSFKPGDLLEVEITALAPDGQSATVQLEQTPIVEGALVAIDNHTGQVLSMVGGYSFTRSKFNRATQAFRQMGSTIKPLLYTAAIDRGMTPTTILVDERTVFNAGAGQPPYEPGNYDRKFQGAMTLRHALEQSRNIPAVKVIEMLGPQQVAAYAGKFGFSTEFRPFLSMALGAQEVTLMEITSAFSAFPNHGIRMEPYLSTSITSRDGELLETHRPQPRDAIRADTAYVITNMMEGVMQRGTGASSQVLKWPLAGKTGTVDDYTDAWFVGFDPNITVGVWIGHDEKKPIGPNETGTTTALPVWIDFMRAYLDAYADRENPPVFSAPGNIVFMNVDRDTGEPTNEFNPRNVHEAFISGTQPVRP